MVRTSTKLAMTTALSWALLAPGAYADLTAGQVWGDWRDYMQGLGYELTATENASSGQVQVSDIRMSMNLGAQGGAMTMGMGNLTFVDAGDGSVNIVTPDAMPLTVEITPPGEAPVVVSMTYTQSGQSMNASGDPSNITYTYAADSVAFAFDQVVAQGETIGSDALRMNFSANNVATSTLMTLGNLRSYKQSLTASSLQYDIFIQEPGATENFALKGQNGEMTFEGVSDIPLGVAMSGGDMSALMDAGFAVDGVMTFGAGTYNAKVNDPGGNADISGSSDSGTLSVKMSNAGLAYSGGQTNVNLNAQVPDFPFPITMAMAKNGFNLMMPVKKGDAPQDFAFGFDLTDFTMSDVLWGLFDPSGQLPRDPATVAVDLSGKAKLLVDFMNPQEVAAMEASGATPGELNAITINSLTVDAVGAKVEGSGDFTFDNTDMTTIPGMPKPVGSIDLSVVGANGLIDKLVGMGMLPEEQAMGARMMMGMLAVPGSEPDSLTSKIEMTDDGQILANGQRIK